MTDLHLLRMKRKEQVETVEKVLSLDDFSQQYKIVTTLLETLFPVSIHIIYLRTSSSLHIV